MRPSDLFLGLMALAFLIFPGWRLARSLHLPLPSLAGFIFGSVGLLLLLQLMEALGLRLSAGTLFPAWLVLVLGAILASRRRKAKPPQPGALEWAENWPLLIALLPAISVVSYRAVSQPLFGADTVFRWNFLAEQMLARETLAFYPPVTAADYSIYAWPDGIAPVVSSLYFWGYTMAGAARPLLTAPFVIAQLLLIFAAVHALTRQRLSPRAAAISCALVAGSPIILWSTAMGQESGLITIALLALLLYLPTSRETADTSTTIMAGLAAALGGLAREYGLILILFGLALGLARRLSARTLLVFSLTALVGVLPWYARDWVRTGNPLFNLDLAGLFPVNTAHLRLMKIYQETVGWSQLPAAALPQFLANCMAALLGGGMGALLYYKRESSLLVAGLLMVGLWAAALGYTAAGFTYALRVLTPALAIAAILGGMAIARWVPGRQHLIGLSLALLFFSTDSSLRALVLPSNIYKIPPSAWSATGRAIHDYHQRPIFRQLADFTSARRVLVLGPTALLNQNGARSVPLWSPEVAYLWDESCSATDAVRRLNENNIGFVLLNEGEINEKYLAQIAFFQRKPNPRLTRMWSDGDMTLFQIPPNEPSSIPDFPANQKSGEHALSPRKNP